MKPGMTLVHAESKLHHKHQKKTMHIEYQNIRNIISQKKDVLSSEENQQFSAGVAKVFKSW